MSLTLQKCDGCGGFTPLEKMEAADLYEQTNSAVRGVQFHRVVYVCPFCVSTANALLSGKLSELPDVSEAVDPADAVALREGAVDVTETGEVKVITPEATYQPTSPGSFDPPGGY